MHSLYIKINTVFLLCTHIITFTQDPVVLLKNNTDRPIQVDLKLIAVPFNNSMQPTAIPAGGSYTNTTVRSKKLWGLSVKYCSSSTCTESSEYDKEYTVKFNSSFTRKYYVEFDLNNNIPTITAQRGIVGNIAQEKIIEIADKSSDPTVTVPVKTPIVAAQKEAPRMTQSEAHMSLKVIQEEVERTYDFSNNPYYQELYSQVVARERKHKNHYVFYNAFSNQWRVPQDLYLKLYKRFHVLSFNIEKFRTFRWIPVSHITPKEFLKNEFKTYGMVNDNEWRVKAYLLSTNLALFGNVGFPGECTFEYYLHAISQTRIIPEIFKTILDLFDDPTKYPAGTEPMLYKYIPRIAALEDLLEVMPLKNGKRPGTLSQIFIPKENVDQVAYLSWVTGLPYEEKMVSWVLTESQDQLGEMPLYKKSAAVLADIKELFKDKKEEHPLFEQILKSIEECKYCMTNILNEYTTYPKLVPGINNMQARLILSSEYLGNPRSGVIMYEYDRIKPFAKQKYEKALNDIVEEIVEDMRKAAIEKK